MARLSVDGWQPGHLSYSTVDGYRTCGMRTKLQKIVRVEQRPSLAAFGGNVVHSATEYHDLGREGTALELFQYAWTQTFLEYEKRSPGYTLDDYIVTGRAPAVYGGKRTVQWWADHGPAMVQKWIDWRAASGWHVVELGGSPAVELGMTPQLSNGVPMQMHIDRVMATAAGVPVIVDLKTGREPETPEQLGLYAWGLRKHFGFLAHYGYFWSPDKGLSSPHDLGRYTEDYFVNITDEAIAGMNAGCFMAKPANGCRNWCGVAAHCPAVN